ncbi:MAG: hypothetical protein ACKVS7_15735 [Gemmatimonadaceae bacterium]
MTSLNLPRKPVVVAICLAVGALQLFTGPRYHGPFRAFVTGYPMDLALPFSLVLLLGVGSDRWPALRHPIVRATAVFLIGAAVEFLQYLGVPLFGRTFDPIDLLMYATGAIVALVFERLTFPPYRPRRPT